MLGAFITHPVARRFLRHPQWDRFDAVGFLEALRNAGLVPSAPQRLERRRRVVYRHEANDRTLPRPRHRPAF
jgi:hypothetical protein